MWREGGREPRCAAPVGVIIVCRGQLPILTAVAWTSASQTVTCVNHLRQFRLQGLVQKAWGTWEPTFPGGSRLPVVLVQGSSSEYQALGGIIATPGGIVAGRGTRTVGSGQSRGSVHSEHIRVTYTRIINQTLSWWDLAGLISEARLQTAIGLRGSP